jgi:hypothetical protein
MINEKKIQIPLPTRPKKTKLFGAHVQSAPRSIDCSLVGKNIPSRKHHPGEIEFVAA